MKSILVPVDFSDATAGVVETAQQLAAAFRTRIVLLHVIEPEPDLVGFETIPPAVHMSVPRDDETERLQLERLRQVAAQGGTEVLTVQHHGSTPAKILEEATVQEAGWIVMGSHGHGALYELLVGSVTTGVLKGARCPVVVVPVRQGKV
jgi:nucleotide-binding universal stress UspA family protein